jgi:hypothetical protein
MAGSDAAQMMKTIVRTDPCTCPGTEGLDATSVEHGR